MTISSSKQESHPKEKLSNSVSVNESHKESLQTHMENSTETGEDLVSVHFVNCSHHAGDNYEIEFYHPLLEEAEDLFDEGNWEGAKKLYTIVLSSNPQGFNDVRTILGLISIKMGDYKGALNYYTKFLKEYFATSYKTYCQEKLVLTAYKFGAEAAYKCKNYKLAYRLFNEVSEDQLDEKKLLFKAVSANLIGKEKEALATFESYFKKAEKSDPIAYINAGICAGRLNHVDKAIKYLRFGLTNKPNAPLDQFLMAAELLHSKGKTKEARAILNLAKRGNRSRLEHAKIRRHMKQLNTPKKPNRKR